VTYATPTRYSTLGLFVLLIALAALLALHLHGAPFGAPPPGPQPGSGLVPVLARALRAVVRLG
jgi:hypothetical protein